MAERLYHLVRKHMFGVMDRNGDLIRGHFFNQQSQFDYTQVHVDTCQHAPAKFYTGSQTNKHTAKLKKKKQQCKQNAKLSSVLERQNLEVLWPWELLT